MLREERTTYRSHPDPLASDPSIYPGIRHIVLRNQI
jgi:hypothetical protein